MIKIVGIESLDYENKQGKHVTGVKVHYNDMEHGKDNVEGSLCGYEWLTPVAYEQMCEGLKTVSMLGLEGDFNYRKNGNYVNVCGFIKRGQYGFL